MSVLQGVTLSECVARCTQKKRATWNVGNISELAENGVKGCVRAKFDLGSSASGPHVAALSFTCEGTTFSGVDLELLGSGYRMSLVKKRIVTGEFEANQLCNELCACWFAVWNS